MCSGSIHPVRRQSGRMMIGIWMLACIVLSASYTANLVASLSVTKLKMPFDTLEEMAAQSAYKYGFADGHVGMVLLKVENITIKSHLNKSTISSFGDLFRSILTL